MRRHDFDFLIYLSVRFLNLYSTIVAPRYWSVLIVPWPHTGHSWTSFFGGRVSMVHVCHSKTEGSTTDQSPWLLKELPLTYSIRFFFRENLLFCTYLIIRGSKEKLDDEWSRGRSRGSDTSRVLQCYKMTLKSKKKKKPHPYGKTLRWTITVD